MVSSNRKGANRERELVRAFNQKNGYSAYRTAAMHGNDQDMPDVFVGIEGRSNQPQAIEAKSGADGPFYISQSTRHALERFCMMFNARPRAAARFDGDTTFYVADLADVPTTDSGNSSLRRSHIEEHPGLYDEISE